MRQRLSSKARKVMAIASVSMSGWCGRRWWRSRHPRLPAPLAVPHGRPESGRRRADALFGRTVATSRHGVAVMSSSRWSGGNRETFIAHASELKPRLAWRAGVLPLAGQMELHLRRCIARNKV
jgi:hypothetical protein